jgi:hypothetical protein
MLISNYVPSKYINVDHYHMQRKHTVAADIERGTCRWEQDKPRKTPFQKRKKKKPPPKKTTLSD